MAALANCNVVFSDGTFKTAPRPYMQLYTLHGVVRDRRIPLCFALLCSKTAVVYVRMLTIIDNFIRQNYNVRFSPQIIIVDFELGFLNAALQHLPNTRAAGCHFHFSKAIYGKINELGMSVDYQNDPALNKFVQLIMALGFLPIAMVRNSYNVLRHNPAQLRINVNLFRLYPTLHRFCTYFEATWINGPYPINLWNVFRRANNQRTINTCEGWHHRWNRRVSVPHPNMWRFIIALQKEETG